MAKKKGVLDGVLDALGNEGAAVLEDVLEDLLGAEKPASAAGSVLDGLLENGGELLQGIGDVVQDLTGLGASNTEASDVARKSGKTKSSSSAKKTTGRKTSVKEKAEAAKKRARSQTTRSSSSSKKKTR